MLTIKTSYELKDYLEIKKRNGKTIGFVPTMGALHDGHISLVRKSKSENDITCVSIFVNPTQFNNKDDLKNYPRMELQDSRMLKDSGCDLLFTPGVNDIYPEEDTREFDLGGLDKEMEGKFRKGHFKGVVQIVSKLFETVQPDRAYFGRKDFQQLAIIKYINKNTLQHLNIQIKGCKTIRESDGLAMSSRNLLLSPDERLSAPLISKTLKFLVSQKDFNDPIQMKELFQGTIDKDPHLQTEYIEIVNDDTLQPVDKIVRGTTSVCVAVYCGKIRLIDNMQFE